MTQGSAPVPRPPRWSQTLVQVVLPCDPMRDAIMGDLHEEFVLDASRHGTRIARARHLRRTAGVIAHALSDALFWRSWVSTTPVAGASGVAFRPAAAPDAAPRVHAPAWRVRALGAHAGFMVLALALLFIGIVGNTMAYRATEAQGARVVSSAGIAGVVLLAVCVVMAALLVCAAPRRRRK